MEGERYRNLYLFGRDILMGLSRPVVDRKSPIREIVRNHPETEHVFERYGLWCAGCEAALFERVEDGAKIQGVDVDALVGDLHRAIAGD